VGDANATASKPRKGRNPKEVGLARGRGGEREDPEGANVRRVVLSGPGETGTGRRTPAVGSKAPRSVQVWEGSRSAQVDEELPPQRRIPMRKRVGVRARWARRAEEDGNPERRITAKEHEDRETGTDRWRVKPWRRNPRSACRVEQTCKPEVVRLVGRLRKPGDGQRRGWNP